MSISKVLVAVSVASINIFRNQGIHFEHLNYMMDEFSFGVVVASSILSLHHSDGKNFTEKKKQQLNSEESLRRVMYLNCWSPS